MTATAVSTPPPVTLLVPYFHPLAFFFEPLHQPFFVMSFFKIGSQELFALAGFKL
jgi:hypothetical protein